MLRDACVTGDIVCLMTHTRDAPFRKESRGGESLDESPEETAAASSSYIGEKTAPSDEAVSLLPPANSPLDAELLRTVAAVRLFVLP